MASKRNISQSLLPIFLAIGVVGGIFIGKYLSESKLSPAQQKFQTILGLIESEYVDRIDVDSLLEASFPNLIGMLDPHSVYIPKSELEAVNEDLDGSFSGVGVSFQIVNDTVVVVEVISDGPAEAVGIVPGDKILKADNQDLTGKDATNENVFRNLRGKKDTEVKLLLKRSNSPKPVSFSVVRGNVPVKSVDCTYVDGNDIGYVRVSKFSRDTYTEFLDALNDLQSRGARKFIIDMRGNSGGYLDQAIYMVNEFLPAGRKIVYTRGRIPGNDTDAVSDGGGSFIDVPITVLTDEFSASAAEIFAGAIQDNDRGLVIGRRSFGKGLVQNQTMLPDSSALRLTIARYYTPSGRCIQKDYVIGNNGKYEMDIADRYTHGEFYSSDSIKLDKSKKFKTFNGRTVFGGGGIMPDVFVPSDTTGVTSYYIAVSNKGLIQKFSFELADRYRAMMKGVKDIEQFERMLPRDNTLLTGFADFAAKNGVPARWFYINRSRDLLLNQIKAGAARNILGYPAFIQILNDTDPTVLKAEKLLMEGKSPTNIPAPALKKKVSNHKK